MNESIDETFIDSSNLNVEYVGFWPRLGALIVDGLIMVPVMLIFTLFARSYEAVMISQILFTMIVLIYKPFMEYKFGATVGKMAVNAKVVNAAYQKPELRDALLRNIFNISHNLIGIVFLFVFFSLGELPRTSLDYNNMRPLSDTEVIKTIIDALFGIIAIVELIVLLTDEKFRSLHDKIAKTYVIKGNR